MQRHGPDGGERRVVRGHARRHGSHQVARHQVHLGVRRVAAARAGDEASPSDRARCRPPRRCPRRCSRATRRPRVASADRALRLPQAVAPDLVHDLAHEVRPSRGLRGERHAGERRSRALGPGAHQRDAPCGRARGRRARRGAGTSSTRGVLRPSRITDFMSVCPRPRAGTASPLVFGRHRRRPRWERRWDGGGVSSARGAPRRLPRPRCAGADRR